jgi:hypothetical protein
MTKAVRDLAVRNAMGLALAVLAISFSGCPGPDRLTDPVVAEGGTYYAALGGTAGLAGLSGSNNGGTAMTADASAGAGGNATGFDWGPTNFDPDGGLNVTDPAALDGGSCFPACLNNGIAVGGTVYQANGTDPAPNVQIGIWLNGTLFTSYSGSDGNFFMNFLGAVDWSNAVVAVRDANSTKKMPANPNVSGNCSHCHNSTQRIVVP